MLLSTRRMEHGAPLLQDFDLGALLGAQAGLAAKDTSAIATFITVLSKAGRARVIRRLSAIFRATEEQLRLAEDDPAVLTSLEEEAAQRPFGESFKDAIGFFTAWGSSFGITPVSSAHDQAKAKTKKASPAASR